MVIGSEILQLFVRTTQEGQGVTRLGTRHHQARLWPGQRPITYDLDPQVCFVCFVIGLRLSGCL